MGLFKLSEIINMARSRHPGFARRLAEAEALARWERAVGAIIAKHARALCVKDKVLLVEVDHPIWRQELHHRKRQILEALNRPPEATPEEGRIPAPRSPEPPLEDIFFVEPRRPGTFFGGFKRP